MRAFAFYPQWSLAEAKLDIQLAPDLRRPGKKRNALIADVRNRAKIQIDEAQLAKVTLPLPSSGPSTAARDKRSPGPVRAHLHQLPRRPDSNAVSFRPR